MRYASITRRLEGLGTDKWAVHYAARALVERGEKVLFLSIGEPDQRTPGAIEDEAVARLRAGRTRYSSGAGEDSVRAAVAARYAARSGRAVGPDQVIFMPGAQSALCAAMFALAESGDEVVVPNPFYATYDGIIAATGARQVNVRTRPRERFHLTPQALEAAITGRTRVLLLNSPSNPTGAVLAQDEIAAIGEVCRRHDLWIVSDEVYETLIFGNARFASPFDNPGLAERTVVVSSLSKSHAMTGYRAGWALGPAEFIHRMLPFAEALLFGCQPFIQDAATFALCNDFAECETMRAAYERRARLIVSHLENAPRIKAAMPEGGMFIFADVRGTGLSGHDFAMRLLAEEKVAVMPGESFGPAGAGHVRIGLAAGDGLITEASGRIAAFARRLAQQPAAKRA
jgi:arginine:pyruvate transaminase